MAIWGTARFSLSGFASNLKGGAFREQFMMKKINIKSMKIMKNAQTRETNRSNLDERQKEKQKIEEDW